MAASGTALTLSERRLGRADPYLSLSTLAVLFGAGAFGGYIAANVVSFDAYRIVLDRVQVLYLFAQYAALALPFFFAGAVTGWALTAFPENSGHVYFASFLGSGVGAMLAPILIPLVGESGLVPVASAAGTMAALAFLIPAFETHPGVRGPGVKAGADSGADVATMSGNPAKPQLRLPVRRQVLLAGAICLVLLAGMAYVTAVMASYCAPMALKAGTDVEFGPRAGLLSALDVRMSEYKALVGALRYPGARLRFRGRNASSRVDVVESPLVHYAPGLSILYEGELPPQLGVTVDGDNLTGITGARAGTKGAAFTEYLPVALPYLLRPGAKTLVLEPGAGLDVLVARHNGSGPITVVEDNPVIARLIKENFSDFCGELYGKGVELIIRNGRSYAAATRDRFGIVHVALKDSFGAVSAGAYSLCENHTYTVEAIASYCRCLEDDGILCLTRWLQMPPSECLRLWVTAITALERLGIREPGRHLAALRSWRTLTLLVKREPFEPGELALIRDFAASRAFDLVYLPDMKEEEADRYIILGEPVYYRAFLEALNSPDRRSFYRQYPYDITPVTDDRPFFFHFFKWNQLPQIVADFGRKWQPFGGGGFLVVITYLVVATFLSAGLVLAPLWFRRGIDGGSLAGIRRGVSRTRAKLGGRFFRLGYFFILGFAYLFVEMYLIQQFILFLGKPVYSFAVVLAILLIYSGLGSLGSQRIPAERGMCLVLPLLVFLLVGLRFLLPLYIRAFTGAPFGVRVLLTLLVFLPLGLMGMPFPLGIRLLAEREPELIPWAWATNGCASVLASMVSILLALEGGYSLVMATAAGAYAAAFVLWVGAGGVGGIFREAFFRRIQCPRRL